MKYLLIAAVLNIQLSLFAQSYTSYFTGNSTDLISNPQGGSCMMGGATEHDEAMKWFLQRANGGDVLVLRASGSDGYNDYMYTDLGITLNSVETIVFNDGSAANETYIHNKIKNAEAIWFAGGDQWNYISYWRNTAIDSLVNDGLENRNIVIGGTSAGMAILGNYYFSASIGTVTSTAALNNPYNSNATVDSTEFLNIDYLHNVITDTHYDNPDRKGRHVVFLARILTDYGVAGKGIACNEYTAVCIDENGLARVFGDYPNYPETAYFLQTNCEFSDITPENCSPGNPLEWHTAIKAYKVNGTNNGANTFDLSDWKTGSGGTWEDWTVNNGILSEVLGSEIDCALADVSNNDKNSFVKLYPNPTNGEFFLEGDFSQFTSIEITSATGRIIKTLDSISEFANSKVIDLNDEPKGMYFLKIKTSEKTETIKVILD